MVWSILRPHAWAIDRKVRHVNPVILSLFLLLLLWGGQWLYRHLIEERLLLLFSEDSGTIIAASLPLGIFLVSLFAMLGFGDTLQQLYLAPDLELLLLAPISLRAIFTVKLMQCSRAAILPAFVLGLFLAAQGAAIRAPAIYFLLLFLLMLMAVIMATALVMTLAILLGRYLPVRRTRSLTPIMVVLFTVALMVGQQPALGWFLRHEEIISFFAAVPSEMARLALVVAGFAIIAASLSYISLTIFERAFQESWNRYRVVPVPAMRTSQDGRRRRKAPPAERAVNSPFRAVLSKEWLAMRRSPRWLLSLAQPLVLVAVSLMLMSPMGQLAETLAFGTILAFLALLMSVQPAGTALLHVAEEGNNIRLLASTPMSMATLLAGKFWSAWALMAIPWLVVCVSAGILKRFPAWHTAWLAAIALWGASGTLLLATALAGLKVDFRAEDLRRRIPPVTNYVAIGVNGLFVAMTIALSGWIVAQCYPDSRIILAIKGISGLPGATGSFLQGLWLPAGLLLGQGVFWVGATLLWRRAVDRLERWE